jgi:hypothetical protein
MSPRLVDGAGASIERWLANLAGPELVQPEHSAPAGSGTTSAGEDYKCPVCDRPRSDYGEDADPYDEDYDYYLGGFRLPLWIALIWQVPWRQRLDIFVIGLLIGLIVAGIAVLWGLLLSQY